MRALKICSTLAIAVCLMTAGIAALADTSIYTGQPVADAGITLGSWGTGAAQEDSEKTLAGSRTIKIDTGGWFQGGTIEFKSPMAVPGGAAGDYLVFTVAPTMQTGMSSDSDTSWYTRGSASASKSFGFGAESVQRPKIQRIRFVFIDASGKSIEVQQGLTTYGESGWMNVSIPVAKLRGASTTDYSLKKILVFSDLPDTIYIGEIKVAQDTTQLKAESVDDLSYATGDTVPFQATVTSGLSSVKCSWDFDKTDGIQEDAIGQYVTHLFAKPGDFVVTLTVTDNNGVKSPYSTTIKVHIE
jgi:hypothetical protein